MTVKRRKLTMETKSNLNALISRKRKHEGDVCDSKSSLDSYSESDMSGTDDVMSINSSDTDTDSENDHSVSDSDISVRDN